MMPHVPYFIRKHRSLCHRKQRQGGVKAAKTTTTIRKIRKEIREMRYFICDSIRLCITQTHAVIMLDHLISNVVLNVEVIMHVRAAVKQKTINHGL